MLGDASDGEMTVADVTMPDSLWSASKTAEP